MIEQLELISPSALKPNPENARVHPPEQMRQLRASITRLGFRDPIEIDENNMVLSGHGRLEAALQLGLEKVPVVRHMNLTLEDKRAYTLKANQIAENAIWDEAKLARALADLDAADFHIPDLGFDDATVTKLLFDVEKAAAPDEVDQQADAAPPVTAAGSAITQTGDIWIMGEHRLCCGNSTNAQEIAALCNDGQADLIFTDPPYGVSYTGRAGENHADEPLPEQKAGSRKKAWRPIANDDLTGNQLVQFLHDTIGAALTCAKETAPLYVCLPWHTQSEFKQAHDLLGIKLDSLIVWAKNSFGLGGGHYRPQHELVMYASRQGRWYGDRAQGNVWNVKRDATNSYVHPTQKPVNLIEKGVRNSTRRGGIVLDIFGGSGSTLIACERLGRRARLMEMDALYCDTIVRRWQEFTGKTAIHAVTRTPFGG